VTTEEKKIIIEKLRSKGRLSQDGLSPKWPFAASTWKEDIRTDEGRLSAEDVRILIHYHFNLNEVPPDPFYRNKGLKKETLERYGWRMFEAVPPDYLMKEHPWNPWKRIPDLHCPNCKGEGGLELVIRGTKAHDFRMCSCITGPPKADPDCPKCRRTGSRDVRIPGKFPGSFTTDVIPCDCRR
jgi:hypothetical protein